MNKKINPDSLEDAIFIVKDQTELIEVDITPTEDKKTSLSQPQRLDTKLNRTN